jgi:glycosyltransferase involved in cell wall biosynthesis
MGTMLAHYSERKRCIVHINLASYASTLRKYFLLRLAKIAGFPVLLHLHGAEYRQFYSRQSGFVQGCIRAMFSRADRVVVLGKVWKDFVTTTLEVNPDNVQVIANAVPAPATRPEAKLDNTPVILFLGRLGDRKGTKDLLQALSLLGDIPFRAVIAGDGDVAAFQAQATQLGLGGKVLFPGWVGKDDATRLMQQASVFVLPSYNEGLPMAVLEALACGVPVVSTAVGSVPDAVQDNYNGFLITPGDVDALAARLQPLLQDSVLRERLATAARTSWEEHYQVQKCGQRFLDAYSRILANQ